jgi:Cytochrome c biogenesis protein
MGILLVFAFIGGIVTILSPCILPILPIILATTATDRQSRLRPYGIITGFVASFTFFTLFLSTLVALLGIPADALRLISVIVIALFGITLINPRLQAISESLFTRLANKAPSQAGKTGFGGGLLIGLSLGLLWTPCVGPILASVISLAITGQVTGDAALITFAYALGTAIPMLMIMKGGQALLQQHPWMLKNTRLIQRAFGFVMLLIALIIYLGADRTFQTYILKQFPQYGAGLTKLEDNAVVRHKLQ